MAKKAKVTQATDPTTAAKATDKAAVDAQDSKTRLWQSLQQSYADELKSSDESYDQAITQADVSYTARGLGRSSALMQTQAQLASKKAEAQTAIKDKLISAYQSGLDTLEQREKEDQRWQQQFDYQKERDTRADQQWQSQFDYQKERDTISDAFQKEQWEESKRQWKQQFKYQQKSDRQKIAYDTLIRSLETGDNPSDELLAQAGLSRSDYEQMKAGTTGSSGSGSSGNPLAAWQREARYYGLSDSQYQSMKKAGTLSAYIDEWKRAHSGSTVMGGTGDGTITTTQQLYDEMFGR